MTRPKVRVAVSWFFIITAIVIIQISIYQGSSDVQTTDASSSIQAQISGKYFVGIKQLAGQSPMLEKNISQVEQRYKRSIGEEKHLANIPVLAEISGRDAALELLELMGHDPKSVMDGKNILLFFQLYKYGSDSLNSSQVLAVKKYGWTGRLALSQDKPDSDPERKAVLQSAFRLVMFFGLVVIAVFIALIGGLILFIIAIVQGIKGNIKSHLEMPENQGSLFLETFAIYLVLSIVLPLLIAMILPGVQNMTILMAVLAGFLPLLWPLLQGAGWNGYRATLGWYRGKGIFREVGAGIVGYITGLPLMGAALLVVLILIQYSGATPSHPTVYSLSSSPLYLLLLACVYAPFVEETLFRGVLYGYLRRTFPWAVSGIISAFIFAIIHPQGWAAVPALGVIGFNLSAIREWRGSTIAPMTAHALNNGSLVLILIIALS